MELPEPPFNCNGCKPLGPIASYMLISLVGLSQGRFAYNVIPSLIVAERESRLVR